MTESPTPSKPAKQGRALKGGLLSAMVATIATNAGLSIFAILFGTIPMVILQVFSTEKIWLNNSATTFATIGFWFTIGAVIAYFTDTDKKARTIWLWLVVALIPVSIVIAFLWSG